ncbi:MAG TPA: MBL fold metallo-hydrolase [Kofleriaceae bacterium]|jgi:glyoxylase-like metal-dependent hydrolase (beta-lactamase superfamily II)|nr:MBL fold metallo-hydrolase [Kofleriaceae bacterium]
MNKTVIAAATLIATSSSIGHAEPKPLAVTIYTAQPAGFQVDSTLVSGDKDAILIDAQFTLADAHRLIGLILDSKKNLTTVYITHWHPDHYFGLAAIKQAFPKARLVALPAAVKEITASYKDKLKQWGPMYGDNLPTTPILPVPLAEPKLTLEGQTLEIHGGLQGDGVDNSYVWIPSIKTVIAGDIVYRGVHPWTAETTAASRKAWEKTIDEVSALKPVRVVAGHKDPKLDDSPAGLQQTRDYLEAFDAAVAASKTPEEVQQKIKAKYPELQLDMILQIGAGAQFKK